jgi:hypothetical protein
VTDTEIIILDRDGRARRQTSYKTFLLVVDGLDHGSQAGFAAEAALHAFGNYRENDLIAVAIVTMRAPSFWKICEG